jgi:hypothetical protein
MINWLAVAIALVLIIIVLLIPINWLIKLLLVAVIVALGFIVFYLFSRGTFGGNTNIVL